MFQGYTITRYMCWLCLRIHKIYTYSLFNTYYVNFILYISWACASIMHPYYIKYIFQLEAIQASINLWSWITVMKFQEKKKWSVLLQYIKYMKYIYLHDAKSWLMLKHWIISLGRDYAGHLKSCRVDFHLNRIWNSWWGNVNTQIDI